MSDDSKRPMPEPPEQPLGHGAVDKELDESSVRPGLEVRVSELRRALALGFAVTPAWGKAPRRPGWSTEPCLPLSALEPMAVAGRNFAVRCGDISGVIVLDDDSPEQNAAELLGLPSTWTAITGRDRHHYYFRAPTPAVANRASAFGLQVEVKSDGTVVLLPGSTHPDTGRLYRWAEGLDPDSIPLAELPETLLEELRPRSQPASTKREDRAWGESRRGGFLERSLDQVRQAPDGDRNNTLNKVAFTLAGSIANGDLEHDEVVRALEQAGRDCGLPEREVAATIASALHKGLERPLPRRDGVRNPRETRSARDGSRSASTSGSQRSHGKGSGGEDGRAAAAGADQAKPKPKPLPPAQPFPLEHLPDVVREFVVAVAHARCVDEAVVATVSLVALASSIGLSRAAYDSYADWTEHAAIWAAMAMRSGARKTPVMEDVFASLYEHQEELHREYTKKKVKYAEDLARWEVAQAKGKGRRKAKAEEVDEDAPAERPQMPELSHVYTSDATIEAATKMLSTTPRGIVLISDELTGFFGSMGRYGNGRTDADRGFWLSVFRAIAAKIDRATKETVFVRKGLVSVVGGVQPSMLARCFNDDTYSSGLAARFLLVMRDAKVKQYQPGPTPEQKEGFHALIRGLLALEFDVRYSVDGTPIFDPVKVPFEDACRPFLKKWIPEWSEEALASCEAVEAAMSKLEAYALRFALVLRCVREAQGKGTSSDPITLADLTAGAELARWYRDEAIRVYSALGKDVNPGVDRALAARVSAIQRMGGAVTVREWHRRNSRRTAEEAEAELTELVKAGLAVWAERPPGPRGGPPTTECRLVDPGAASSDPRVADGDAVGAAPDDPSAVAAGPRPGADGRNTEPTPPEVPSCTVHADGAMDGDSGEAGRMSQSGEVPSCVMRRADANVQPTGILGPKNEVDTVNRGRRVGDLHDGTSEQRPVDPGLSDGDFAQVECMTHDATHNLYGREAGSACAHSSERPGPDGGGPEAPIATDPMSLACELLGHFSGSWCGPAEHPPVPFTSIFALGPGDRGPCYACRGTSWWRRRDSGRGQAGDWVCDRCHAPAVDEDLIERLDTTGGAA